MSPLTLGLGSVIVRSFRASREAGVARAGIPWAMSVELEGNVTPFLCMSVSEIKCIPIRWQCYYILLWDRWLGGTQLR